ncbi:MAG: rhodanese-like domain-containing protein, partial [Thermoleophilia bacterium]
MDFGKLRKPVSSFAAMIAISLALVIFLTASGAAAPPPGDEEFGTIADASNDPLVIDVRSSADYSGMGHIPGSINIAYKDIVKPANLATIRSELVKHSNKTIVLAAIAMERCSSIRLEETSIATRPAPALLRAALLMPPHARAANPASALVLPLRTGHPTPTTRRGCFR